MHLSIGLKIFSVALLLLFIMASAAALSTWKVREVSREVEALASYYLPLTDRVATVQNYLLQQELVLHKMLREIDTPGTTAAHLDAHLVEFEKFGQKLSGEIAKATALAERASTTVANETEQLAMGRLSALLENIERQHKEIRNLIPNAVAAYKGGNREVVEALSETFDHAQSRFDASVERIMLQVLSATEAAATLASRHEGVVFQFNIAITAIAFVVGLLFTGLLTRSLVRPVRALRDGTRAVEAGDLSQNLPVTTQDEIADLTHAFNSMIEGLRAKERLKATFGTYVDPRVVEGLLTESEGDQAGLGTGQRKRVTVFFSDVAGFTAIGELLSPVGLVRLFNEYFAMASAPIVETGGVIDKYIGDAVMAFWCPPFVDEAEQARLACTAALAQFDQLETLRRRLPDITGLDKGLPNVDIRIGIATGDAVVGSIGSDYAKNYTAMGDTVNLGARLEQANKLYGTRILICGSTREMLGTAFETREIDFLVVSGKSEPVRIFELLCAASEMTPLDSKARDNFESALAAYRACDWDRAEEGFRSCLEQRPEDRTTKLFLARVDELRCSAPSADWDGVWRLTTK